MARGPVPSRGSDQFMLRMPEGMREQLRTAAAEHGRSMNTEIVERLAETLSERYLPISEIGIMALFKRLEATSRAFEDIFYDSYMLDLDGFIADQAVAGNRMNRVQAVRHILWEYLREHGYVQAGGPPELAHLHAGPLDKVKAIVGPDLGSVVVRPEQISEIAQALEEAAKGAILEKLKEMEMSGQIKRNDE